MLNADHGKQSKCYGTLMPNARWISDQSAKGPKNISSIKFYYFYFFK